MQESEGIDHPARLFGVGDLDQGEGVEDEAAPRHDGAAQVGVVGLVAQFDQRLAGAERRLKNGRVAPAGERRRLEAEHGVLAGDAQLAWRSGSAQLQGETLGEAPLGQETEIADDGDR